VRQHAEEKRSCVCAATSPGQDLLVAFVGDGEKGRPVELPQVSSGAFTLASAPRRDDRAARAAIYIESEDGYSDQAEVEVVGQLRRSIWSGPMLRRLRRRTRPDL